MTKRFVLMTPGWQGASGIDRVSAESIEALKRDSQLSDVTSEVWSLESSVQEQKQNTFGKSMRFRFARGSKARFAMWGVKAGLRNCEKTTILCMHLHLAPIALPMVARGARLVVFLHGIEAWLPLVGLRARALRAAKGLISNSRFTAERFCEFNPSFDVTTIEVCHLGVRDTATLITSKDSVEPFILIVGRLEAGERYKGHCELISLWPRLSELAPRIRLFIVGDGNDRKCLEQKAKSLEANGRIRFFGRVDESHLLSLYRDCSFFVMPSTGEGFGLVFLEAMRAGKACIGGKGAAEEVIQDGITGLIVDPSEENSLYSAVKRLWHDTNLSMKMGIEGRKRYEGQFTRVHFAQRLASAMSRHFTSIQK